jgi:hypothetical protein
MELVTLNVGKNDQIVIAPIGDIQWSGDGGPTAQDTLKRHIDRCLEMDAWYIGMGDYTDFASPSNRARLTSANVYDTAQEILEQASDTLVGEVFERFLKPTKDRWIGLLEGHHFYEFGGRTSDMLLAEKLGTRSLGTSCYVHLEPCDVTIWAHHGCGGGILPGAPLNKLYHVAAGVAGADVYLMGHTTKAPATPISRIAPVWKPKPDLVHRTIRLANTGGFSRSNIPGHRRGNIPRGDYAEQGMMGPSPLGAPLVIIDARTTRQVDRVRVLV